MWRKKIKKRFLLNLSVLLGAVLFIYAVLPKNTLPATQHSNHQIDSSTIILNEITITLTGDIMPGSLYPAPGVYPPHQAGLVFDSVSKYLKSSDITFGNLETVLMDTYLPAAKICADSLNCYAFRSPESFAEVLKAAGFTYLNLANNHSADFGAKGIRSTQKSLENAGLLSAGVLNNPYLLFRTDNLTIAVCGFSHNTFTPDVRNYRAATEMVKHLDSLSDIVIVSMHIGAEGPAFDKTENIEEVYLEEMRGNPYKFARIMIDAGADIIWGHGPHVTRALDLYKNRFIAYSLGNFFTYWGVNIFGKSGISPLLQVTVSAKGEFRFARVISTIQSRKNYVYPDSNKKVLEELIRLTKRDAPNSGLVIDSNGIVTKAPEELQLLGSREY